MSVVFIVVYEFSNGLGEFVDGRRETIKKKCVKKSQQMKMFLLLSGDHESYVLTSFMIFVTVDLNRRTGNCSSEAEKQEIDFRHTTMMHLYF